MRVVIAHSHLNPGGVTRIIESQIGSLENDSVTVIVGACQNPEAIEERDARLEIIESLNYLVNRKYSDKEAVVLLHQIHAQIKKHVSKDSILHFHNLNLGKNPIVTYAVYLLAKEGYKVFNHAHDFAEDRATNLQFLKEIITDNFAQKLNDILYPDLPNYHFGVLNSFDFERLLGYGVRKERIEWLPNPVTFSTSKSVADKALFKKEISESLQLDPSKLLVTYPVRVIQRKNIGELILLASVFQNEVNFVVTQPPQNPVEIERYKKWTSFCQKENISMTFEAGTKVNFETLLIASDFCITTSYKEGFGMVYLEPWLLHTPVVGRDIDFISKDFVADGFEFPLLYSKIEIPGLENDFKDLHMEEQMQIISDVHGGKIQRDTLFEQNPFLTSMFNKVDAGVITKNISIIKNNYSLKGYGIKLQERYKKLVG